MDSRGVVFVTGGASGIGLAVVEAIRTSGWQPVVADTSSSALQSLHERYDGLVPGLQLNVADEDQVIASIDQCERQFGPIAAVVNSAGTGQDVPALNTTSAVFRSILEVNLLGSFVVAREAARHMRSRGAGTIINIASVSGIRGNVGRTAYGASKGGVIAMTKVLAVEWAEYGIRVNAIAPGPIDTPLAQRVHTREVRTKWVSAIPMRRYGTSEEVARAAVFILDPAQSGYITGQTLCVDGGFTIAGLMSDALV